MNIMIPEIGELVKLYPARYQHARYYPDLEDWYRAPNATNLRKPMAGIVVDHITANRCIVFLGGNFLWAYDWNTCNIDHELEVYKGNMAWKRNTPYGRYLTGTEKSKKGC